MSAQHTPGPWHVDLGHVSREHLKGRIQVAVWDEDDGCIAACMDSDANALLIAAAPDLLAALRGVLRIADRKTDEFDAARAAIAKALGESA